MARSTKSTPSLIAPAACKHRVSVSISLPSRGSFHLSLTVLFAIGHWLVFSLGRWASHFPTGFHVSRGTRLEQGYKIFVTYASVTLSGGSFQILRLNTLRPSCSGCFLFARRYLENRVFFLFLRLLRCFSSPGSLLMYYFIHTWVTVLLTAGFPHSDIFGSTDMCSSPKLFAACHVLRRLPVPGHPPCALVLLTCFFFDQSFDFSSKK